jgi:hypothetical protein
VSQSLWDWWEGALADELRATLMDSYDLPLSPALARELWLQPVAFSIVEASHAGPRYSTDPWTLNAEVREFVAARAYERRHPDQA